MMSDYDEALFAAKSFVAREFELLAKDVRSRMSGPGEEWSDSDYALSAVANAIESRFYTLSAALCTEADREAAERKRAAELMGESTHRELER